MTQARYKSGPNKGRFKPSGKSTTRKSTTRKRTPAKRKPATRKRASGGYTAKRRRSPARRNPAKIPASRFAAAAAGGAGASLAVGLLQLQLAKSPTVGTYATALAGVAVAAAGIYAGTQARTRKAEQVASGAVAIGAATLVSALVTRFAGQAQAAQANPMLPYSTRNAIQQPARLAAPVSPPEDAWKQVTDMAALYL